MNPDSLHHTKELPLLGTSVAMDLAYKQVDTSKATQKALSITELLEQVLLYLPLKTLSSSKQVCRSWKNTIDGSLHLQKKLFLRSSDYYDFKSDGFYYPILIDTEWDSSLQTWRTPTPAVILNPSMIPYAKDLGALARAPDGPWRDTFMSQPAMTELKITIWLESDTWNSTSLQRVIKNPYGITIRDVATCITRFLDGQVSGVVDFIELSYTVGWMC